MRAAIAWSYDLLTEPEQRLFTRLAVFIGSFELEAAEEICGADLDTLQSLLDKSLLRRADDGRFFLLATTREYALEQLDASGERDRDPGSPRPLVLRARRRSRPPGRRASRRAHPTPAGSRQRRARPLLGARPRHRGRVAARRLAVLRVAGSGPAQRAQGAGTSARSRIPARSHPLQRADALAGFGITLAYSDTPDPARTALTEALTLYREAGDERNEARVLMRLGGVEIHLRLPGGDGQMDRAGAPDLRASRGP